MIQEGAKVRPRLDSQLGREHPEMIQAIGVVGSIMRGAALGSGATMHLRFRDLNLVALNVAEAEVEAVDHLDPETLAG